MQTIYNLPKLYKRDTTGKVREWTMQYGYNLDKTQAGTRTISGLQDGKKVRILKSDNASSLEKRVIKVEHRVYPKAIVKFFSNL